MSAYQDKLASIKSQLIAIRDNPALQKVEANSDVAKGLSSVFTSANAALKASAPGVASSTGARNAVTNGESIVNPSSKGNGVQDAFSKLNQEYSKLQKAFEVEKSTREGLEQDKSIGDQKTNQELMDIIANFKAGGTGGNNDAALQKLADSNPELADRVMDQMGYTGSPNDQDGIAQGDPIAQAMADNATNQERATNQQLEALSAMVEAEDVDLQSTLKNIKATADLQIKRVRNENERLAQASRVAGIVSGRGMYSPYEHEGIISEVIQEGLDRVTQIELTAQDAKLEAKKAHRDFRYEAFVQSSEMVAALSELKKDTIVDIGRRLQEVEQEQRDKMKFDQEQADRNSFILAPELVGATPEQIQAAALANGIEPGALMRTVAEYSAEQDMNDLDRQVKEESILSSQQSRRLAQARFNLEQEKFNAETVEVIKPMDEATRKYYSEQLGYEIPPGLSLEAVNAIETEYGDQPPETRKRVAMEIQLQVDLLDTEQGAVEIGSYVENDLNGDPENDKRIRKFLDIPKDENIYESKAFQDFLTTVEIDGMMAGKEMTAAQKYKLALSKMNEQIDARNKKTGVNSSQDPLSMTQEEIDAALGAGLNVTGRAGKSGSDSTDRSKLDLNFNDSKPTIKPGGLIR